MTCAQGVNAGHSLSTLGMIMLLEYLPQEPSDPVYGKLMSGGAAYEWEAQSQYRASPFLHASSHIPLLPARWLHCPKPTVVGATLYNCCL